MIASRRRVRIEAVLLPCLIALAWTTHGTNRWLEARQVEMAADGRVGVLPDGKALRVLSLGFERLVADLFWIRTTYYVGDPGDSKAKWPAAEALANLVTDIDPHFDSVYVLMSSVLGGLRGDHDAAIRLLEKGASVSRYWRIQFLLGFEYFMEKQDYERGAQAIERAIALGGGPPYLPFLVSRLYSSSGDATTAMQFVEARLRNEENPEVRAQLEQRLSDLWVSRDLDRIDAAIADFQARKHRAPAAVHQLVAAGLLTSLPRDPKGREYGIAEGRATTQMIHERIRLNQPRPQK